MRRTLWIVAVILAVLLLSAPAMAGDWKATLGTSAAVLIAAAYVAPSIVAARRKLPNRAQVYVVNILTGWTFIGWVISLVMATVPGSNTPS